MSVSVYWKKEKKKKKEKVATTNICVWNLFTSMYVCMYVYAYVDFCNISMHALEKAQLMDKAQGILQLEWDILGNN